MKKINIEDVFQVFIGSSLLAVPIAFTEESWQIGRNIPLFKLLLILAHSLLLNAAMIFYGVYSGNVKNKFSRFLARIAINYGLTFTTVFYILYILDVINIESQHSVWISQTMVVSFPASLGGAVIDSFDKE